MPDRPMSRDELIQNLAIRMAASNRNPPILRGTAAPRDPWERDRLRQEFAAWFVSECIDGAGFKVIDTRRPLMGSDMAGFRMRGTPPQMYAN